MDVEQARRFQQRRRVAVSPQQIIDGIIAGDRAMLARGITLIESSVPAHQEPAQQILEACLPHTNGSIRLGITGVPGVGKSTFIEALGIHLTHERGQKVAVLAVDPSSPVSGGSILGDKTRMTRLGVDPHAYIRPSPASGSLGGVARKTREAIILCEAAGYRNIFVETVGVGQSEVAVAGLTDFFLLLMLAGAGDELQGMKRGIMEMTDLMAINKADGDNRVPSEAARRLYESALKLFPPHASGWSPRVVTCSSRTGEGIAAIWKMVLEHHGQTLRSGWYERNRREQARKAMYAAIENGLRDQFFSHSGVKRDLATLETEVLEGRISAYRAARQLLDRFSGAKPE
jgi:LAO/AO transport system kinase